MKRGFTLVEIMIVVSIIGLLAALAMPAWMRARDTTRQNLCVEHLWEINSIKEQWAIENDIANGQQVDDPSVLTPYIQGGIEGMVCPTDLAEAFASSYQINPVGTFPICLIEPERHSL